MFSNFFMKLEMKMPTHFHSLSLPFYCWIYTNISNMLLLLYPLTLQTLIFSSCSLSFGQGWNCELLSLPQYIGYMSRLLRHCLQ